jgi:hypothetical protein
MNSMNSLPARFALAMLAIVMAGACANETATGGPGGGQGSSQASGASTAPVESSVPSNVSGAPQPEATAEPSAVPEASPTAGSDGQPPLFRPGETVTVQRDGAPYLEIVVSRVSQHASYTSGYLEDRPHQGNVYIQAFVTYRALVDGATYNPFDWQVFCNETAVDQFTALLAGPEPVLSSGTLPKGRKAEGWLVYEVPVKGRCVLSYGANPFADQAAVFEVLLRAK